MGKIEELGLCDDIIDLVLQGESARNIARILKKRGIEVHYSTIQRWINSNKDLMRQVMLRDKELKEKKIDTTLDACKQIQFLTNATKAIFEEACIEGDRTNALRALERLEKQLILYHKLVGPPDPKILDFNKLYPLFEPHEREIIENAVERTITKISSED